MHPAKLEQAKAQLRSALLQLSAVLDDDGVEFSTIVATIDWHEGEHIFTYDADFGVDKNELWIMGGSL